MASLQFPDPNVENPWIAPNGVEYEHDGVKWNIVSGELLEEWIPVANINTTQLATNSADVTISPDGKVASFATNPSPTQDFTYVEPFISHSYSEYTGYYFKIDPSNLTATGGSPVFNLYLILGNSQVDINTADATDPANGVVLAFNETTFADGGANGIGNLVVGDTSGTPIPSTAYSASDVFYIGMKGADIILRQNGDTIATHTLTDVDALNSLVRINTFGFFTGGQGDFSGYLDIDVNVPDPLFTEGADTLYTVNEVAVDENSYPVDRTDKTFIIRGLGQVASTVIGDVTDGSIFTFNASDEPASRTDIEPNVPVVLSEDGNGDIVADIDCNVLRMDNGSIQIGGEIPVIAGCGFTIEPKVMYAFSFTNRGNSVKSLMVEESSIGSPQVIIDNVSLDMTQYANGDRVTFTSGIGSNVENSPDSANVDFLEFGASNTEGRAGKTNYTLVGDSTTAVDHLSVNDGANSTAKLEMYSSVTGSNNRSTIILSSDVNDMDRISQDADSITRLSYTSSGNALAPNRSEVTDVQYISDNKSDPLTELQPMVNFGNTAIAGGMTSPSICRLGENLIAYIDGDVGSLTAYEFTNGSWSAVGTPLVIADSTDAMLCELSIADNRIVLFTKNTNTYLRCYNWNGTTFSQVGNTDIIGVLNYTSITYISDNNFTYVFDGSNGVVMTSFDGTDFITEQSVSLDNFTSDGTTLCGMGNGKDVAMYDRINAQLSMLRLDFETSSNEAWFRGEISLPITTLGSSASDYELVYIRQNTVALVNDDVPNLDDVLVFEFDYITNKWSYLDELDANFSIASVEWIQCSQCG